jgi:hypothetical protein
MMITRLQFISREFKTPRNISEAAPKGKIRSAENEKKWDKRCFLKKGLVFGLKMEVCAFLG